MTSLILLLIKKCYKPAMLVLPEHFFERSRLEEGTKKRFSAAAQN